MIMGKNMVHHYSPERRNEQGTVVRTIVFRQTGDSYIRCKEEVDVIYDKVRRLLTTAETWIEYSLDEDITKEAVQELNISINKTLVIVANEIEELIIAHGVIDRGDLFELRDVAVQLQEIAEDIFKPYIKQ